MTIVCIVSTATDVVARARSAIAALPADSPVDLSAVTIITGDDPATVEPPSRVIRITDVPPGAIERVIAAVFPIPLITRLRRYAIGRLLVTLLPADPARVFWRRLRRSPDAVDALSTATIVVACDPAAVRSAWFAYHRLGARSAIIGGQG